MALWSTLFQLSDKAFLSCLMVSLVEIASLRRFSTGIPEAPRRDTIVQILAMLGEKAGHVDADDLTRQYTEWVNAMVPAASEIPGAQCLLQCLATRHSIFVSSNTPLVDLRVYLKRRGWLSLMSGVFGFPDNKEASLKAIISLANVAPKSILVVGDGESDRLSALSVGAHFYAVKDRGALERLLEGAMRSEGLERAALRETR